MILTDDDSGLSALSGISKLASMPKAQVIVTDSQAASQAAQALFPSCAHVYYSAMPQSVDWGSLAGKSVVLIPTADMAHKQEADWIATRIRSIVLTVKIVEPEESRPEGWTLADATDWTPEQAIKWAVKHAHMLHEDDHELAPAVSNGTPAVVRITPKPAPPPVPESEDEKDEKSKAAAEKFSELSLADMFVRQRYANWRYCAENKVWYQWRGDGWYEDKTQLIRSQAAELIREVNTWDDIRHLKASTRRSLCSAKTVSAIVSIGASSQEIALTQDRFDQNPWILGVPGGSVDLQTGLLTPPNRLDYVTKRTSVAPQDGEPMTWLAHLDFVLGGDPEKIGFLRRYLGYMLTGLVRDHALVFLYGGGGNGKGTIVETFVRMMGDYGYAAPVNLLMEAKNDRHPTELAQLRGKRAVSCSEPPTGSKWDDGRIRSLTGGDTVTARKMNQDFSSFAPSHKLMVMGNHKPVLRSVDEAIKRRFNILDFSVTIPPEKRDTAFGEKLMKEAGQILSWAIRGCLEWQQIGLSAPKSMLASTSEYLRGENVLEQFIEDRYVIDPDGVALSKELYRAYEDWCEMNGEKPMSSNALTRSLTEMPGLSRARKYGQRAIAGLRVRPAPSE